MQGGFALGVFGSHLAQSAGNNFVLLKQFMKTTFFLSLTISMEDLKLWQQHTTAQGWHGCDAHLTWPQLSPAEVSCLGSLFLSLSFQTNWLCCRATHPTQLKHLLLPGEESSLKGPVFSHWHDNDGMDWSGRTGEVLRATLPQLVSWALGGFPG